MKLIKAILAFFDLVDSFVKIVCTVVTGLMATTVVAQVVFRYILKDPLVWTEELSRYLLIWSAFVGASSLIKTKENMAVDFFIEKAPLIFQRIIKSIVALTIIAFLSLLLYYSLLVYPKVSMRQMTPALQISMFYVQLAVIVGIILMILQQVNAFVSDLIQGEGKNV